MTGVQTCALPIYRRFMSADDVDAALRTIMSDIHERVAEEGRGNGTDRKSVV